MILCVFIALWCLGFECIVRSIESGLLEQICMAGVSELKLLPTSVSISASRAVVKYRYK